MAELDSSIKPKGRAFHKPILRSEIEEAQRNTNSNGAAARWLGVGYPIYKRYAQLYGLFEGHMNREGRGIDKGWSKKPTSIPLRDILANKHPNYSRAKLKNRLIARNKLVEECTLCGFSEKRITDGQVPLMLSFKDGNPKNMALENLELLCYNCMFLTTGAPSAVYRHSIKKSFTKPDRIRNSYKEMTTADHFDPNDPIEGERKIPFIARGTRTEKRTPEEQEQILQELAALGQEMQPECYLTDEEKRAIQDELDA